MASIDTMANNSKEIKYIERLWVMGGASVVKDRTTHEIVAYYCYCNECKIKSVSGDGGIAFQTAEDLLVHRKMKAFECPCGCGFHICEEFGSIVRHLDTFHKEVLEKLQKEGLDLTTKKRVWIYPDYENKSYTLTQPMPLFEASPLENAGVILSMTPPRRVASTPSPVPEQVRDTFKPKPKKNGKFVPFNAANASNVASAAASSSVPKKTISGPPKTWGKTEKPEVSFSQVMAEQKEKAKEAADASVDAKHTQAKHYAQFDMRKEKQCSFGKGCVKRDRPFACALNHDGNGDIIKRGTELTEEVLCPFERPRFNRCGDGRCTKVHLEGRAIFIEQKKQQYFDADPQVNMSYSSLADTLKKEKAATAATAIITTSAEGTTIQMSHEDALAVAALLFEEEQKQHQKHQEEDSEWKQPKKQSRKGFANSSLEKTVEVEEDDENEEVDDNDDLSDPAIFAARAAHVNSHISSS
jgi:hypothetical protein